ncbi:DNA primase [Salmonella enterica subsp. enterica serovar Uzaramo]|uniref:DNA primase n=1 Tax=Salmonella enterica TaxID=28901 RepID=A0A760ACF3_SALER|nr:DNA primase [Salmonella enterica subsp. enterica serovar Uzaramo]EHP5748866.1 toprim domain-containing protein [Salmonella enterica]ELD8107741.1 toprim domain-containing protein [Salmonella enterica subsp. enterica serovar Benin]EHP5913319.1 toprim domain-containing protein [Salmonella enterica]EIE1693584.1 toprim domain-containing protein [Salmonella enterica]
MKTVDAAKGRWSEIFEYYGLPPVTGKKHFKGKCPLCGREGDFRCDDQDGRGTWICNCDSGDGMRLVTLTQKRPFYEICNEIDKLLGNSYQQVKTPVISSAASLRQRVLNKFSKLQPLRGTSGEAYLNARGIFQLPVEAIRFNEKQRHAGRVYQSMYSLATDDKGALCYLHQTLLDGAKKADIGTSAKRLKSLQEDNYLSYAQSVAIRMFPVSSTLGIAEGIETALSCYQIYKVNTWAVMNSNFMKKFRTPPGVKHLIVFADKDKHSATGQAAAFECAHANLLARNDLISVSVRWPDHEDFNHMLINGDQVREDIFYKKVAA